MMFMRDGTVHHSVMREPECRIVLDLSLCILISKLIFATHEVFSYEC